MHLTSNLVRKIDEHGLSVSQVQQQLHRFTDGISELDILRPATIGKEIMRISADREKQCLSRFEQAQQNGRAMKFCPASGAASRMFKTLQSLLVSEEKLTNTYIRNHSDDSDATYARKFFDRLRKFAFFEDLEKALSRDGFQFETLLKNEDYKTIISYVLEDKGLSLSSLPKALIPFHRYSDHSRTPLEEHIVEAIAYARDKNGVARIHFTISPEHQHFFSEHLSKVRERYKMQGTHLEVSYSYQKPETDTIAADSNNKPFLDSEGNPVFRPGGHGALLANLNELGGDIIFIKNIDNIVPERLLQQTVRYKKIIGGVLSLVQDQIFTYLNALEHGNCTRFYLDEVIYFIKNDLHIHLPPQATDKSMDELHRFLFKQLSRPIRVCGIVINQGEPGGGPFLVRHDDGSASIQIIEDAQFNMENPHQKKVFESATHFSPTDLACGVRDFKGRPFNLLDYCDPDTGFISTKTYLGRDLKALELPGLWNGSMAHWITLLVEVPVETFNPVKTVNDLLREEHQSNE
jgi:hypothetical protein